MFRLYPVASKKYFSMEEKFNNSSCAIFCVCTKRDYDKNAFTKYLTKKKTKTKNKTKKTHKPIGSVTSLTGDNLMTER